LDIFILHAYFVCYYVAVRLGPNVATEVFGPSFEEVRYLTEVLGWFPQNLQDSTSKLTMIDSFTFV
jgi:hypothetical protein